MNRIILLLLVCVTTLLLSATSISASVVAADHADFGVGAITRDTDQGLDFLDLTFSYGRSSDDISTQFGAGGDFHGFRYASEIEVINLINNFGFIPGALPGLQVDGTTGTDQLSGLIDLLGGVADFSTTKASGITGTPTLSTLGSFPGLRLTTILTFTFLSNDRILAGFIGNNGLNASVGSFLVVDESASAVPEPSSIILLATGMLCLLGCSRRRKKRGEVTAA